MDLNFPKEKELREFVKNYVEVACNGIYPEDEWTATGDNWDINLWIQDGSNKKLFTVYPVVDSQRNDNAGISFDFEEQENVPVTAIKNIEVVEETGRGHFKSRLNHFLRQGYILLSVPAIFHNGGNTKFVVTVGKR